MWKRFFNSESYDKGTLNQIKHLIHRTAVDKNPKHNMKPTEDFLKVVLCAHVVTAAKQCLSTDPSLNNCEVVARKIVHNFVHIGYSTERSVVVRIKHMNTLGTFSQCVLFGMISMMQFKKEIRTGLLCAGKYCYRYMFLSEQKATELKWSRTVNTVGRAGCNIPCDLHMEHLNCRLKFLIGNLGSNTSPKALERAAKSLGVVQQVCRQFEEQAGATVNKPYASYPSFQKDLNKIVELLSKEQVFVFTMVVP